MAAYCDLLLLTSVLTLWVTVRHFTTVYLNSGSDWVTVFQMYTNLKMLAAKINKVIGSNVTLYLTEFVLDYATNLDRTLVEEATSGSDWMKTFTILIYFTGAVSILCFSADVSHMVRFAK